MKVRQIAFRSAAPFFYLLLGLYVNLKGQMNFDSKRFLFYIYILLLYLLSIRIMGKKYAYITLWLFILVEISIASLSIVANPYEQGKWLIPTNSPVHKVAIDDNFRRHQLLQVVPKPNRTFKYSKNMTVSHNKFGLRGSNVTLAQGEQFAIVYGGSTVYELGLSDTKTWVSKLNEKRDVTHKLKYLNGGMLGYSSVEAVVQTAFYNKFLGRYPNCNIYYLGWNDLRNVGLSKIDPGYENYWLRIQYDAKLPSLSIAEYSPTAKILYAVFQKYVMQNFPQVSPREDFNSENADVALDVYRSNLNTITSLNQERKVITVFIPQILNVSHRKNIDGLANSYNVNYLLKQYNETMRHVADKRNAHLLQIDNDSFRDYDFVDDGHFSESGSRKFSNFVSKKLNEACKSR